MTVPDGAPKHIEWADRMAQALQIAGSDLESLQGMTRPDNDRDEMFTQIRASLHTLDEVAVEIAAFDIAGAKIAEAERLLHIIEGRTIDPGILTVSGSLWSVLHELGDMFGGSPKWRFAQEESTMHTPSFGYDGEVPEVRCSCGWKDIVDSPYKNGMVQFKSGFDVGRIFQGHIKKGSPPDSLGSNAEDPPTYRELTGERV